MSAAEACHVCGRLLVGRDVAICNVCDRPFHLRVRTDTDGEDCGIVVLNERYLALDFTCFACLGRGSEPAVGSRH
jgi:hypothetical protein